MFQGEADFRDRLDFRNRLDFCDCLDFKRQEPMNFESSWALVTSVAVKLRFNASKAVRCSLRNDSYG